MTEAAAHSIRTEGLAVRVPGRELVNELTLDIQGGSMVAVLGQNGAGKSLSMLTLAGVRGADEGHVQLNGQALSTIPRQQLARLLALLPQDTEDIFPATVLETVMIGRHPHIARFQWESSEDIAIAQHALASVDLHDMQERDVATLSGGERRRLAIAQILTQAPGVFLLDEPTNHLDPQHQLDVLQLFRDKADAGALVVATLHDVNLAARFSDHCLLLFGDGSWDFGPTSGILEEEKLSRLFATNVEAVAWRDTRLFVATRQSAP